jgi:Response regulators consisting of a CheY-like receiver domain and a winged-helix DNA-binding domain
MDARKVKIMLVEDNPDDVELTIRDLKKNDLDRNLHVTADGRETFDALQKLADTGSPLPDLMLLDIGLPDLSGLDLLRELKADHRFSHIPVVMLTGSEMVQDIQKSYDLGAVSYLMKPISVDELVTMLNYVT